MITVRDITDIAGCREVVAVQLEVWGRDSETVPASVLVASAKRGGILIGAYENSPREGAERGVGPPRSDRASWGGGDPNDQEKDGAERGVGPPRSDRASWGGGDPNDPEKDTLVGFVWSMPGWRDGAPMQWSHMLGVRPAARGSGVGKRLKIAQRERALAQGITLIEWTFDPLQALNAHLNMAVLGCIAVAYRVDTYGEMIGPLHRGTPTDRLVAEWWIREPHVLRRLAAGDTEPGVMRPLVARAAVREAPVAIAMREVGGWLESTGTDTGLDAASIAVPVPPRFSELQQEARDLALAWRLAAREVFMAYLGRGYRVVDFLLSREDGGGHYILAKEQLG